MFSKILHAMMLAFLSASLVCCASKTPDDFDNEKALYDHGSRLFDNKKYADAVPFLETFKNKYPTSRFITDAEYKLAECYFKKSDYIEAIYAFQNFRALHPTNPFVPQAIFRIAQSYYRQIPGTIDRDQTNTANCIESITELLNSYPDFSDIGKAASMLEKCKRKLAERELYVANFYLRQKAYKAALGRLEIVRDGYDFKDLKQEAAYKLAMSYAKLKENEKAIENINSLLGMNPDDSYRKKASELLSKMQPKE